MSQKFRRQTLTLLRLILKLLDEGYYPAKIARIVGRKKQTIHYHIKRLLKFGYIRLQCRDAITVYEVTQAGKKFLDEVERGCLVGRVLRLHNVVFKYPVLREPVRRVDWRRVELRNWGQLVGRELGLTVRKNPSSVEIFCGVLDGDNPFELLFKAREEADRLAGYLEEKFGMVLGRGRLSRKPHFGVYDPVAAKCGRFFELTDDLGKFDESEGYGEIDWFDPEAAKNYLLLPNTVSRIQKDVDSLRLELNALNAELQELRSGLTTLMQTWTLVGNRLLDVLARLEGRSKR